MTPTSNPKAMGSWARWLVAALLIALLLGSTAAFLAASRQAQPAVTLVARAPSPTEQAASLPGSSPGHPEGPAAAGADQPGTGALASTAAPWRALLAAHLPRQVGTEGYGPTIAAATAPDAKPTDAYWAALQIGRCKQVQRDVESVYKLRAENTDAARAKGWDRTLEHFAAEQRRCQTVTPDLEMQRVSLLLRAVAGGETAASVDYMSEVRRSDQIDPAYRDQVLRALHHEGLSGNSVALLILATGDPDLTENSVQRSAFRLAYQAVTKIRPDGVEGVLKQVLRTVNFPEAEWSSLSFFRKEPPNEEAQRLAAEIVENFKRREQAIR